MAGANVAKAYRAQLSDSLDRLDRVTTSIVNRAQENPHVPGAVSTDYLELLGLTAYAWLWGVMAEKAPADVFGEAKKRTAEFFYARLLPKTLGLEQSIAAEADVLMDFPDQGF